jgi:hypothetical protein
MDVQDTHALNPALPPPMSLAQAKANLLQFGEATAASHGELGKNALWLSIAAAVAGIAITGFSPRHKNRHQGEEGRRSGHRGLSLLSLLPLLKPLLPIVLQYLAKHKAAREQAQQTAAI